MKKIQTAILAIALVGGVSSAFIPKIQASPKRAAATYQWLKFNHDGTRDPSMDEDATIAQAESDYACPGTVTVCATGTKDPGSGTGPNTATLRFSN